MKGKAQIHTLLLISFVCTAVIISGCEDEMPEVREVSYFPVWRDAQPIQLVTLSHDSTLSNAENGAALKAAVQALTPGQRLEVGAGTYSVDSFFDIALVGTEANPIWIDAKYGERPVITRLDEQENCIHIGWDGPARYIALRGFEIMGGGDLINLRDWGHVWIDGCLLHDGTGYGIRGEPGSEFYVTRNEIFRLVILNYPNKAGIGLPLVTNSVIALNHIYDITANFSHGISVSGHSNWLVENHIHNTSGYSMRVLGSREPSNVVEQNICYNAGSRTLDLFENAIVRNNLLMNLTQRVLSAPIKGGDRGPIAYPNNLQVIHNTIIAGNQGIAAHLGGWGNGENMVFSNNAVYSDSGNAVEIVSGFSGVNASGNVFFGAAPGAPVGSFINGTGLGDFVDISWDATTRDGTPSEGSVLIGAGDDHYAVRTDISGSVRQSGTVVAGAFDRP